MLHLKGIVVMTSTTECSGSLSSDPLSSDPLSLDTVSLAALRAEFALRLAEL